MQRVRRVGCNGGVTARRGQALRGDRWRVVAVDQVVRDPRMVGMFRELLFEDRGRLEIRGICLVGGRLCPREVQSVEDLRLVVVRVFCGERLVGLGAGELARALGTVREILVVRGDRLEVVALARSLRADLAALVDRRLREVRALGRSADALERVRHQDGRIAPGGDGARIVLGGHFLEGLLRRGIVEGMQHRHAAQQLLLHRRAARVRELDLSELVALLGEGDARCGQRKSDQGRCDMDTRLHV